MKNIQLILEGGGMRGAYTAGVLDCFLDNQMYFENIIGVSAGAGNATSYISREKKRAIESLIKYSGDKRYLSYRGLIKNGSIFGMDFIFKEIPEKLMPFDYDAFHQNVVNFEVVTTDCNTGEPHYHKITNLRKEIDYIIASSSLPLVSQMVRVDGLELLDGGISDPLPIKYSLEQGYEYQVVVLTRNRGYQKKKSRLTKLLKIQYHRYPKLIEKIKIRHMIYNESLELIYKLEEQKKAIVIAPSKEMNINRIEKNKQKLLDIYELGYQDAQVKIPEILAVISQDKDIKK